MQLYILQNGIATGPFEESQIIERWKRGILRETDLVWGETLPKWVPLKSIIIDERTKEAALPANTANPAGSLGDKESRVKKKGKWGMSGLSTTKAKRIVRAVAEWVSATRLTPEEIIARAAKEFQVELSPLDAVALLGNRAQDSAPEVPCHFPVDYSSRSRFLPSITDKDMSAKANETQFYVLQNNEQTGPLDEAEIVLRLKNGSIRNSDLLWAEGLSQWKPVDKVFAVEPVPTPKTVDDAAALLGNRAKQSTIANDGAPAPVKRFVVGNPPTQTVGRSSAQKVLRFLRKADDTLQNAENRVQQGSKWVSKNWPLLASIGVLLLIVTFLLSWSSDLSIALLLTMVLGILAGVGVYGGSLTAGLVLAVLVGCIGGVYMNWRFPELNPTNLRSVQPARTTDGVFESATEKIDKGLPLNKREEKRINDILNYNDKKRAEEIERRNGERP